MLTVLLTEFYVLIIFVQFIGIDLFIILNSAIQLDLNFNFSRIDLLDNFRLSFTYVKSFFILFSKTIGFIVKSNMFVSQIIYFLMSKNVTGDFVLPPPLKFQHLSISL